MTPTPVLENDIASKTALLAKVSGNYLVDVDCAYSIGLSFQAVYATCVVQIADKRLVADPHDLRGKSVVFIRTVETEVALDPAGGSPSVPFCFGSQRRVVCRTQWTKDSAAPLRQALNFALTRTGALVGKELGLTAQEVDASVGAKENLVIFFANGSRLQSSGHALEGGANVKDPGKAYGFSSGTKPATLIANSDGVLLIEKDGNLYHKRVVTVQ
jgi:hypothetical protein